ncbi:hypothetical protein DY000_02017765 [Brassica cretica]|uniref:Uncharacterized protein n=1 Tax=Brassica cretica TaxID=69181 RepID=A0ABQ7D413_BRACR|nr:hypothetical protein DY000_02017765 [Brassica cretica]
MSSSHGDKRSSDVEKGEATSPAPILTSPVEAPACVADHLSFRERLVRCQAEKEQVRAGAEFPSSSALAIAPGHGTEVERAADSMPPPPAKKEIVLALHAPSVVPVAQPKGRKRKFTKGGDGESSQQGASSIASGLRGKFMSLINGMISECGSETSRLVGELLELQGRWSETEAMLTAVKHSHSVKVSKLEVAIGELERDLGKTASSLLKEKKAREAKSSESFQSETPPTLEAEEARLSDCKGDLAVVDGDFNLILADLKSACFLPTCSEGSEGKDPVIGESRGDAAPGLDEATGEEGALRGISEDVEYKHRGMVLGSRIFWISCLEMLETSALGLGQDLGLLSVLRFYAPKGRKRKFTKGGDGESSQQGGSSIASGLRGKFMSLIDGMIIECGSETSHLAGELLELQGRWSESEAMLTAVKDSHPVKVSKLEVAIGELERDLGKTASSLLKEKKPRKAKSSKVRQLQRQIEGDAGLASRGIREPTDALRSEFQARLAKISAFLGSLECIRNRDLALATIEGGVAVVQSFQSETPPTLETEEAQLQGKGSVGKGPVLGEGGGDTAPGLDEATGEEGALCGISEDIEYKHRCMVLGSRIFWISCLEMLETSALGLGQDLGLLSVLRFYAVTSRLSIYLSKVEVAIGELERDLGKTASSLLKEKKARKPKSSEVRRLQRQIEGDAGLASRRIREATDALRSEFQACLAKISAFLGSLECIRSRNLALATIEGGVAVVQSFQSDSPPTLEAEEARLSGCKGDLAVVDGDFDLILADLKSACFLPTCSEGLDEATGEE